MNVYLIGLMGSGKSTLGAHFAKKHNLQFVDVDDFIQQQEKKTIAQIFKEKGEEVFRQMENQALQVLTRQKNCLLATGGGAPMLLDNQKLLQNGLVFYLHVKPHWLFQRLKHDKTRPLLQVDSPFLMLEKLYQTRHCVYLNLADCIVHLDGLNEKFSLCLLENAYENFAH